MAVQYSRILFGMFMIILMISQLSCCCEARRCPSKEIKQTENRSSIHGFPNHFYTKTQEEGPSRNEVHPIYGVSLRDVPGGPNPLHN
ncbi:CLE15 protein [Senna tora]|uniref:CLE15 protein n=1 Tax=Senna tora TaxID=362788 RepID=A0A834TVN5_9FABA|nr:CLE15 protein [Senna tora]